MSTPPSAEKIRTASKVLAKIRSYDPSFPVENQASILAWATQLTLANVPEERALAAVDKMYSKVTDASRFRPLPGALVNYCREIQREEFDRRQERKAVEEKLEGPERISMAEWERRHGEKFPRGAVGKSVPDDAAEGPNPLWVECPYCRAGRGVPCSIPGTAQVLKNRHPSRVEAAAKCSPNSSAPLQPTS